ncbi:carbonic anhydrase [Candidatus Omnitrophota bacterium]
MKKTLTIVITVLVFFVCVIVLGSVINRKMHSVASGDALTLLKKGNARFAATRLRHPSRSAKRRKETARYGQNPYAIVLTCADSRVPVEILFDAGIGDIFVVENAGNIAQDDIVAGSIEYAAKHLNSPLLVILGHTECGAVQAALSDVPAAGNIRVIQKIIEPAAAKAKATSPHLEGSELLNAAIENNVLQSKTDLLARSKIIKDMHDKGSLKIVTGVYDIKTGTIDWDE